MSQPPRRQPQSALGTVTFGGPPLEFSTRDAWLRHHRLIRSACLEQPRPGAFIFAAQADGRPAGQLWLAATATPRASTLGRHESVDLPITPDAALSLRHLLFVVRLVEGRVRFSALDLESSGGLHANDGPQRLVEAERPTMLRTASLTFFCIPTGPSTVLPADPLEAWALLERTPKRRGADFLERFLATAPHGRLAVQLGRDVRELLLDDATLERGVLLGRNPRCDVTIPDQTISRVHAVVLAVDGVPHLIDAGSSNGVWRGPGDRVHCVRLTPGAAFQLGGAVLGWRVDE